jgi:hypothetical protein
MDGEEEREKKTKADETAGRVAGRKRRISAFHLRAEKKNRNHWEDQLV